MGDEQDGREEQDHPKLTEEEDKAQRGGDPDEPHGDPERHPPEVDPDLRKRVEGFFKDHRQRPRQDGLWPYLLIRAFAGDHGQRNPPLGVFWESPDVLVVPGVVDTLEGHTPTLSPTVGEDHTIFVRVWNLGRLAAVGVKLRVWWANPAFSFNDPTEQPHYIGGTYLNLPDSHDPLCHQVFRIPTPWRPIEVNGGHECLLARVECFADTAGGDFDANVNRHIGQRNLNLVAAHVDLAPLLARLSAVLPRMATLQVLHGMADVRQAVLAQGPEFARKSGGRVPDHLPEAAAPVAGGVLGHLGAVTRTDEGVVFVPPQVMSATMRPNTFAGTFGPGVISAKVLGHPDVTRLPTDTPVTDAVMAHMGVKDLRAGTVAAHLSRHEGETHLLRFQATTGNKVVGGYSVIVQS